MAKVFLLDPIGAKWVDTFTLGKSRFDPINIGYLGAYLKSHGFDVEIFQQRLEPDESALEKIIKAEPDILAVSSMTFNFNSAVDIARAAKRTLPNLITIFGGYHVTSNPSVVKSSTMDYVVRGEGEQTLLELISALARGSNPEKIPGIAFEKDGSIITTEQRPRIEDLDSLPFPLRYRLEDCKICDPFVPAADEQTAFAQITYSRGCYHNCSFCTSPAMWGSKVIHRSAKNTVDEIELLKDQLGVNALFFTDLTFNADKARVRELCNELIKRKVEIRWSPGCRITEDKNLLEFMKEAGCVRIAYGVESLDDNILKSLHKGTTIDKIKHCLEITNNLGIISRAYLMLGYLGESRESVEAMKRNIVQLPADQLRISLFTPFPGTRLYEQARADRFLLTENTDDYTTDVPVLKTGLSEEELVAAKKEVESAFYSSKEYQKRIEQKTARFPHLRKTFDAFFSELRKENML